MDTDAKKLKNIKKLVAFMRKAGVLSIKQADIEINLSPQAILLNEEIAPPIPDNAPIEDDFKSSPEDALFWSSPGFDG